MWNIPRWLCIAAWPWALAAAAAAPPAAVVESVRGAVAGVELMDYVVPGQVIKLGPKDSIVLGYMKSCWRETITGGTVTVGDEQSAVQAGQVVRTKVGCDPGRAQLRSGESSQSAATLFRSMSGEPRLPPVTVHGRSPVFEVKAERGRLVIERVGPQAQRIEVAVDDKGLVRNAFFDLDRVRITLEPGASYTATLGSARVDFKVDWDAQPGPTPVVGRLLRFE